MKDGDKYTEAKRCGVCLPQDVLKKNYVCVYGFFALKDDEEFCFYVGKATDLNDRMLSSNNGHIHKYINGFYSKTVPGLMKKYHDEGYEIEVRILKEVDYRDTNFTRAAHRLALAEYEQIVHYQEMGQCLDQKPEGSNDNEITYWQNNFRVEED